MSSEESDDEPLSVLAATKKTNPQPGDETSDKSNHDPPKKKKKSIVKKSGLSLKISKKLKAILSPPVTQRPTDVWLYLKDLNPSGPYTCLLCSSWFINKSKMIMHYALNHRKDFCGICRYFVPDRDAWWAHEKFHTPWPCSQCIEAFASEALLRAHLRGVHNLVHCRLCHFRVPADEQYDTHLFQKHNVTNPSVKEEENLWDIDYDGSQKFICLLCTKVDNTLSMFFNHYMGYHHFTLKCLTSLVAGKDPPFMVDGADVSSKFIEDQLKGHTRLGYVDLEPKTLQVAEENKDVETFSDTCPPPIKQETHSDFEETKTEDLPESNKISSSLHIDYKGVQDFDVTLTEVIVLESSYFEYLESTQKALNSNTVPENSDIKYKQMRPELLVGLFCALCKTRYDTVQAFLVHISKMHNFKVVPLYSCRVCATTFDTYTELKNHITEELGDFEDLWICQFCEKEFDNREASRKHLTEHWDSLEFNNCFSPHLGFKCKYCPTLFWNEPDREAHQIRAHINKHRDDFYKCESCSLTFSDKVWFMYHYLEKHYEQSNKYSYLLKCCVCCIVLPNLEDMRIHFEQFHPEAKKLYCSLDPCKFKPLGHRKSFKLHVKSIHGSVSRPKHERAVSCGSCGREFASARACTAHASQVHGPGKFKCKLCRDVLHTMDESKSTKVSTTKVQDIRSQKKTNAQKCKEYREKRKLQNIRAQNTNRSDECYEGDQLQVLKKPKTDRERSKSYYDRQKLKKTEIKKTPKSAAQRSKEYREKKKLKQNDLLQKQNTDYLPMKLHYLLCHPGRHPFECAECGKSFQYKSSLYMHKQEHAPNRQNFTCDYCGKVFAKKDSFREHVQIHEGPRHACSYCPMRFVQRSNMLRHERRHTGERPYACPQCPRTFADKGACTAHTRTHSKATSFACIYCGQTFVQKSKLTYHIRKHTGENLESCTVCSKLFTSACSLREHMKTHVEKKQIVKCPLCDKKYQDERYMLRHLRTSHTHNTYTCPLCQKVVTSATGLRHHVITHSRLNTFRCKCCPKAYAVKKTIIKHLKKRHGLDGSEINIKDYFTRLDPRDCELGLDEETMNMIFGPRKFVSDVLIGDYVTLAKNIRNVNKNGSGDEQAKESDSTGDEMITKVNIKEEVHSDEEELEPTDFVSVKIESMEDCDSEVAE